ncbi:MAG: hypothetical protein LBJ98_02970 [Endomicrobium sp.]|jgi:hypothetical protein|nr:hypothetical protein [Endomicrobium sp.]
MKKVFLLGVATVLFACQLSFASKNGEFTFGIDKILSHGLKNSINYSDGKKDKIEKKTIREDGKDREVEIVEKVDNVLSATISKDYGNNGFAPKLEYCYYVSEQLNKAKAGIGLGVNKFFNSDFDPFNVYAIGKIVCPPINDKCNLSFGTNLGYGVFNSKYETAQGTFKADKVYSVKVFVKFDYKNFFVDLAAMKNIIPIDAKIKTENEGVKRLKENINYDVIMLGIGYNFAI